MKLHTWERVPEFDQEYIRYLENDGEVKCVKKVFGCIRCGIYKHVYADESYILSPSRAEMVISANLSDDCNIQIIMNIQNL
jgi:hypothetical protein